MEEDIKVMPFDSELDVRGLFCPEPVMMLHGQIKQVAVGEILRVLATDPSTTRDIVKFCRFLGHELVEQREMDGEYHFYIRRQS